MTQPAVPRHAAVNAMGCSVDTLAGRWSGEGLSLSEPVLHPVRVLMRACDSDYNDRKTLCNGCLPAGRCCKKFIFWRGDAMRVWWTLVLALMISGGCLAARSEEHTSELQSH